MTANEIRLYKRKKNFVDKKKIGSAPIVEERVDSLTVMAEKQIGTLQLWHDSLAARLITPIDKEKKKQLMRKETCWSKS